MSVIFRRATEADACAAADDHHRHARRRPVRGTHIEVQVVQGRPPSTIDAPPDHGSAVRYCLAEWVQSGLSAVYTFLYRV